MEENEKTAEKLIGEIFDYFAKVGVAAIKLTGNIKKGDKIRIRGTTTDFKQEVKSMQIDRKEINNVRAALELSKLNIKIKKVSGTLKGLK